MDRTGFILGYAPVPLHGLTNVRFRLPEETVLALEEWVNYGNGKTAAFDFDEFLYLLLSGDYLGATRLGSAEDLSALVLLAELSENAPSACFGSPEAVRTWQGLVGGSSNDGSLVVES